MAAVQPQRRKAPRDTDPELRGRRADPRAYIVFPASVEALSGQNRVTLLDVSCSGARLEGSRLPEVGKDAILRCAAIDTFGTIVWAVDRRCGMQFDEPIGAQELATLGDIAASAKRAGMTPHELLAAADWMSGLAR